MKLRKWMCTLALLALTAPVFAGNTSDLKMLITQFFMPIEMMSAMTELSSIDQHALDTAQAVKEGLLLYESRLTAQEPLSEPDQAIEQAFARLPGIFNKIQHSSEEIIDEATDPLILLVSGVLANQQRLDAEEVDVEMATGILWTFALAKASAEGALSPRVQEVLQQEIADAMGAFEDFE